MRLSVTKSGLILEPESIADEVYVEHCLNLKAADDSCFLTRVNVEGLSSLSRLETRLAIKIEQPVEEPITDPTEQLLIAAVKNKSWNEASVLALVLSDLAENS